MSRKWFTGVSTITELKSKYRELARKWHPDASGKDTNREMKEINNEYEYLFTILPKTEQEQKTGASAFDGWREAVNSIIGLDDITIELVGSWVWVSGNTYKHKTILKQAGYYWASKKRMWYWRAEENAKKWNRKSIEMEDIRNRYGSQILASNPRATFQAIPASN